MPTTIPATCPHCKATFLMIQPPMMPNFVKVPHIMCNCIVCQETFLKHSMYHKFVPLVKEVIAIFHQTNDMVGFTNYIASNVLLMEADVISKKAIAKLTVNIHKVQDVDDFIKSL